MMNCPECKGTNIEVLDPFHIYDRFNLLMEDTFYICNDCDLDCSYHILSQQFISKMEIELKKIFSDKAFFQNLTPDQLTNLKE